MKMKKIALYLMSNKGYKVLEKIVENHIDTLISYIVYGEDKNVLNDYSDKIVDICKKNTIKYYKRGEEIHQKTDIILAISWRWLIAINNDQVLIVLHDSLLPKYRGFAPLVSALINGDTEVGVTALFATSEYDKGNIIKQSKITIQYPIKIETVIDEISDCYNDLVFFILENIRLGKTLTGYPQDESEATYSLWRDEEDYNIDWNRDSGYIKRFIDALGYPYKGALTTMGQEKIRVMDAEEFQDVKIDNRTPGKIIFVENERPIVVCGSGLLKIHAAYYESNQEFALPFKRFRIRFH